MTNSSFQLLVLKWRNFNSIQLGFLTCTFRASCYSTRLAWAHTPVINIKHSSYNLTQQLFIDNTKHAIKGRKEGNVLINDALNTFYLRYYGVRHMVKDHSDSEKANPLPSHRLLFPINSKGSFICIIPKTG